MHFPKERIRFSKTVDGRLSEEGYLVLDLKGLDIEGATSFVIEMAEIERVRAAGDRQSTETQRVRDLLGGP